MGLFGEPTAQDRMAWQVQTQIRRVAVEGFGTETIEVPIGDTTMTHPTVADGLAGVQAAVLVRNVAARMVREYAEQARGDGRSWDEVGQALGAPDDDERDGLSRAEWAFEQVAIRFGSSWSARARWRCASCGQRVNDSGPFDAHPTDSEDGHAPGCARQARAIQAWRAESGWDQ